MSVTFWLPALNPEHRFRYPFVSLSKDMCWWFWFGRGVPRKLFKTKFNNVKVWHEIRNFEIFIKYCHWWHLTWRKITKFACWREFQCLAAPSWPFLIVYVCKNGIVSQVILFSAGASKQKNGERNFRACRSHFGLLFLNADNRFRYPPVSLSRDLCWWFWFGRGAREQLFDTKFGDVKVWHEIRNVQIFMNYWRWWHLTWGKMTKFRCWREFQCFAAPPWSFLIAYDL